MQAHNFARRTVAAVAFATIFVVWAQVPTKFAVNAATCVGCRQCQAVCPVDAIAIVGGKAVIDPSRCIGCGSCESVCPTSAVHVALPDTVAAKISPTIDPQSHSDAENLSAPVVKPQKPDSNAQKSNAQLSKTDSVDAKTAKQPQKADSLTKKTAQTAQKPDSLAQKSAVPAKKTDNPAVVTSDKCIGCTLCLRKCATGAISMVNGKATIDPEKCVGSGKCLEACPVSAITYKSAVKK